jgi:hypothetical protein
MIALPNETFCKIFDLLNDQDLVSVSQVCLSWRCAMITYYRNFIISMILTISESICSKSRFCEFLIKETKLACDNGDLLKLYDIFDLIEQFPTQIWWEIDRACLYIKPKNIKSNLLSLFRLHVTSSDDTNLITILQPESWGDLKMTKTHNLFFRHDLHVDAKGVFYYLIHRENHGILSLFYLRLFFTYRQELKLTPISVLCHLYDRLLKLHKTSTSFNLKKSRDTLRLYCDPSLDYNGDVLSLVLGDLPHENGNPGLFRTYWTRGAADWRWFPMELMLCIFDHTIVNERMNLINHYHFFGNEYCADMNTFIYLMRLDEFQFELLLDFVTKLDFKRPHLIPVYIYENDFLQMKSKLCYLLKMKQVHSYRFLEFDAPVLELGLRKLKLWIQHNFEKNNFLIRHP